MIDAVQNIPFEALLSGAAPEWAGHLSVEVIDPSDNTQIIAPTEDITQMRTDLWRALLTVNISTGHEHSFSIRWLHDVDGLVGDEELHVHATAQAAYKPSVAHVGALLRTRTVDDDGNKLGTFTNDDTEPTEDQAVEVIDEAVAEMESNVGTDIPVPLIRATRAVTSLLAAMNVELSYFPEQVGTDKSPYEALERRYNSALPRLIKALDDVQQGGDPGAQDDELVPLFNFDEVSLTGEMTYDPVTERWVLRDPPPPSAGEGTPLGVWS